MSRELKTGNPLSLWHRQWMKADSEFALDSSVAMQVQWTGLTDCWEGMKKQNPLLGS